MPKTKLVKAAGRFGVRYGQSVKRRIADIESRQRLKQHCIFCNGRAKRTSKGVWNCLKCGKKFAGHAYYLEQPSEGRAEVQKAGEKQKAKVLKK